MARIRYLHPGFFKDEDLAKLNHETRLFFAGLWCHADKEGRLEDRPIRLKVEISPYDNANAQDLLTLLAQKKDISGRPYILRYEIGGERYIQIVSWYKYQKPHHTERDSDIPPPPTNLLTVMPPLSNGSLTPSKSKIKRKIKSSSRCHLLPADLKKSIVERWNLRVPYKIQSITGERDTHLKARIIEGFVDRFDEILNKYQNSDFLSGKQKTTNPNHQNWRADFDWIIKNGTNWVKILEGKYDNVEDKLEKVKKGFK